MFKCAAFLSLILSSVALAAAKPERYLIKFPSDETAAEAKLAAHGLTIERPIPELGILVAVAARKVSEKELAALGALYVERDREMTAVQEVASAPAPRTAALDQIHAPRAWKTTQGRADVRVAILDTGVNIRHPDLRDVIVPGTAWNYPGKNDDVTDLLGHGTHVAGIVMQVAPGARIVPIRLLARDGESTILDTVDSILLCVRVGARVMNASWADYFYSHAFEDALRYAGTKGTLLVAAAANDSWNNDSSRKPYPSSYDLPNVVSVANVTFDNGLSATSSWGPITVSLAAPGTDILSTLANGGWGSKSGTSMASPMVAGVAALMLSADPALDILELRNGLLNATTLSKKLRGRVKTAGVIDAATAVEELAAGFQLWPARITVAPGERFQMSAFNAPTPPKSGDHLSWRSANPAIAKIVDGVVTGVHVGITNVEARAGDKTVTATVAVLQPTGSGCSPAATAPRGGPASTTDQAGSAFGFFWPFLVTLAAIRRRW